MKLVIEIDANGEHDSSEWLGRTLIEFGLDVQKQFGHSCHPLCTKTFSEHCGVGEREPHKMYGYLVTEYAEGEGTSDPKTVMRAAFVESDIATEMLTDKVDHGKATLTMVRK